MRNYYLYFAFNVQLISNSPPHLLKTDFNNHKQNNNVTPLEFFKNINIIKKSLIIYIRLLDSDLYLIILILIIKINILLVIAKFL